MRRRHPKTAETTVIPEETIGDHQSFFGGDLGVPGGTHTVSGARAGVSGATSRVPVGAPAFAGRAPVDSDVASEAETIVVRVRKHGRHLTLPVLMLLAIAGAAGYFIGWFPEAWMNLTAFGAAIVLMVLLGIAPILGWLSHRAVITTRRVIVHRGFFVRHRSEISLARVREVKSRQNLVQRVFGSGDIDLLIGADATSIVDVPDVKHLHASLQELSERNYDAQLRAAGRFGY